MADLNEYAGVVALAIKAAIAPYQERVAMLEAKLAALPDVTGEVTRLAERVAVAEVKALPLVVPTPEPPAPDPRLADFALELAALRERVTVAEVKAGLLVIPPVDGLTARLAALEQKGDPVPVADPRLDAMAHDLSTLRERVAVVEVRQPMPGPAGKDGAAGRDGVDGLGMDDLQMVQDGRRVTVTAVKGDRVKPVGTAVFPAVEYRDVWEAGASYERGDLTTWGGSMWHCNEPTTMKPGESKAWTLMVKRGRDGRDGKDAAPLPVVTVHG